MSSIWTTLDRYISLMLMCFCFSLPLNINMLCLSVCPPPPPPPHSGAPPPHGPVQTSCSSGSGQGAHPSHRLTPAAADSEELPPIPVTTHTRTCAHTETHTRTKWCLFVLLESSLFRKSLKTKDCSTSAEDVADNYKQVATTAMQGSFCVYDRWSFSILEVFNRLVFILFLFVLLSCFWLLSFLDPLFFKEEG